MKARDNEEDSVRLPPLRPWPPPYQSKAAASPAPAYTKPLPEIVHSQLAPPSDQPALFDVPRPPEPLPPIDPPAPIARNGTKNSAASSAPSDVTQPPTSTTLKPAVVRARSIREPRGSIATATTSTSTSSSKRDITAPAKPVPAELKALYGHTGFVCSVAFSPDGTRIVSGSFDKSVRVWDASTGAELKVLHGHTHAVYSVAFSPDGMCIVSGSYDNSVMWDASTGAKLKVLLGHTGFVRSVAFSPDGTWIVSGSDDKSVKVLDASTGAELKVLYGHTYAVYSVAFSPDSMCIVSGSDDHSVMVWDASTGAELKVLHGHTGFVRSVAFSPDGTWIVSGSDDKSVKVWDASTGAELKVLRGHTNFVNSVAFSPDGTCIVSGSDDRSVRVWDASTGAKLKVLHGHTDFVNSVAFSPDGTCIVSGSSDGSVRVWDASTGKPASTRAMSLSFFKSLDVSSAQSGGAPAVKYYITPVIDNTPADPFFDPYQQSAPAQLQSQSQEPESPVENARSDQSLIPIAQNRYELLVSSSEGEREDGVDKSDIPQNRGMSFHPGNTFKSEATALAAEETLQSLTETLRELRTIRRPMNNRDTISRLCKLLNLRGATLASEVGTASDAELLVDFLLILLRNGILTNWSTPIQNVDRKARRLMFELLSKIDTVPRSLFILDVEKDSSAIAVGGFGNVFEGKHNGRLVALKLLYKSHHEDSIEKDFIREALSWGSLSHRFILPLLGIHAEKSRLFLVSPFMVNGTLRQWRKKYNPVQIDEIHRLLLEVAEGFEYIHGEGIVHGDLHGGNVLLDSENHCQITDFGSPRHVEAVVTHSTTALALSFAAPELFGACTMCGEPDCDKCYEDPDEQHKCKTMKTDVYAFGCLYYSIFFDTNPFQEKRGFFEVMRAVLSGAYPRRPENPRMEDDTWNLLQHCWERNPSRRLPMERIVAMLTPPY